MRKILLPLALTLALLSVRTMEVQSKVNTNGSLISTNTDQSNGSSSDNIQAFPETDSMKATQGKPAGYKQQPVLNPDLEELYPTITKLAIEKIFEALQVVF